VARTANTTAKQAWWRTRTGVAVIGFALVAAFYVLREHWGHMLGALPYLLLLACPLMHLLMPHHRQQRDNGADALPDATRRS
jgi:Flp pilus assembly protein TadB